MFENGVENAETFGTITKVSEFPTPLPNLPLPLYLTFATSK